MYICFVSSQFPLIVLIFSQKKKKNFFLCQFSKFNLISKHFQLYVSHNHINVFIYNTRAGNLFGIHIFVTMLQKKKNLRKKRFIQTWKKRELISLISLKHNGYKCWFGYFFFQLHWNAIMGKHTQTHKSEIAKTTLISLPLRPWWTQYCCCFHLDVFVAWDDCCIFHIYKR